MMSSKENFCDTVAELCMTCFQKLPKSGKPKENEWTVLSCIIMEQFDTLEVVALGTGTKCIGETRMSADGDILNDSHAEVICRRAFLRYLYENMLHGGNSLLLYNSEKQNFQLNNCKFHFFTTHVPCGDAAIFAKQDDKYFGKLITNMKRKSSEEIMSHDNKKIKMERNCSSDIFRTGAKCLESDDRQDPREEGTNFHITGVVRTKPGRGDKTLSVSCSDKIAKWNYLGVQGALMSILLHEPIYFDSITVAGGTPYNEESMKRALFSRLESVKLEHPYGRKEIVVGQSNLEFIYGKIGEKNSSSTSIVWFKAVNNTISKQIEVSVDGMRQGVTKKNMKSVGALKICKKELFKNFISVLKQYGITIQHVSSLNNLSYIEAKAAARDYQKAWLTLKKSFKVWTIKNKNLLKFHI